MDVTQFANEPIENRTFTYFDLAFMFNRSTTTIRNLVWQLKLQDGVKEVPTKTGHQCIINYSTYMGLKKYFKAREEKDRRVAQQKKEKLLKMASKEKAEDTTELEALHPLVKDKRCLRLSYWPNTVPNCFQDLQEEEGGCNE